MPRRPLPLVEACYSRGEATMGSQVKFLVLPSPEIFTWPGHLSPSSHPSAP